MHAPAARRHFARLELPLDADARDIRRAYARELKKIDQANDGAGFQQLRGAYEAALQFAAWRAQRGRPDDDDGEDDDGKDDDGKDDDGAGRIARIGVNLGKLAEPAVQDAPAPDALPVPSVHHDPARLAPLPQPFAQASPVQLAAAVTDALCVTLTALGARTGAVSDLPYREALQRALADERLFGIEARIHFEQNVAAILAQGWRPGHEALLVAAAEVFRWSDRRHLATLGRAGAAMDRALEERSMFDHQPMADKQAQRSVLHMLRQADAPTASQIARSIQDFMRMQERFPHWLPVVAPAKHIAYWDAQRTSQAPRATPSPPAKSSWGWGLTIAVVFLISVVRAGIDSASQHDAPPPAHSGFPRLAAGPYPLPVIRNPLPPQVPGAPVPVFGDRAPAPHDLPVPQARLDEIRTRIDYKPAPDEASIPRQVQYQVFLDVEGRAFGVNLIKGSGSPELDAAVKKAILGSKPFPPATRKIFYYGVKYVPGARIKRKRPAPEPAHSGDRP